MWWHIRTVSLYISFKVTLQWSDGRNTFCAFCLTLIGSITCIINYTILLNLMPNWSIIWRLQLSMAMETSDELQTIPCKWLSNPNLCTSSLHLNSIYFSGEDESGEGYNHRMSSLWSHLWYLIHRHLAIRNIISLLS